MNQQSRENSTEKLLSALKRPVKLIVQGTGDAVAAAAMLTKMLQEREIWFSLTFCNETIVEKQVIDEHYGAHIFLGSVPSQEIKPDVIVITKKELLHGKNTIISVPVETSISAFVYQLLKMKTRIPLVSYALLGEQLTKKELRQELVNEAIAQGIINDKVYVELFSTLQTPINKLLEQIHDYYLPGVTGSSVGVVNMLQTLNIQKSNTLWQKYNELRQEEKERLAEAISEKTGIQKQKFYKTYYCWLKDWQGKTVDEVAEIIEACITLQKPAIAYGYCLQHHNSIEQAQQNVSECNQYLTAAVQWYGDEDKKGVLLQKEESYMVIRWYDVQELFVKNIADLFFNMGNRAAIFFMLFLLRGPLEGKLCLQLKKNNQQKQELLTERLKKIAEKQELRFSHTGSLSLVYPLAKEEIVLQQVKEIVAAVACEERI